MAERKEVVTAEFVANLHSSFKKAVKHFSDQIRTLKTEVDSLNSRFKQTGETIAKDYGQNIKAASAETQRFGSLVKKFGADTTQGFKSALPYFTTMAKGATKGGEALEKANRMATNYVHGLKDLQTKLNTVGKGFAHNDQTLGKWGNSVKAAGIRQGELAGALKITSNGIKMLNPEAQRYLNLTNSQYNALQKLEGRSQGYVQSMQKVWNQTKGNVVAFNDKVKSLDKADKAIARTADTMNKAGKNGQRYYETASRLTVANNMMTKGFIDANGNIAAVANNMGRGVKQAGMFQRAVMGIVDSFKSMARYAAGAMIFYQLFNLFRSATQSIIDFSQGMKDLQAIINATDEDIYKLGETVKVVAANTKYSTTEVAEGMKLLGQAGLSTAEIMQSIEYVAQLATGTMTDFATVSDLMTTTIRAFQMDFLESGRVADVFANAINRSKLTVEKLRVAFNYLAPLARSANITFEETSAALMMLANAGIRASTMGTGMRQILIRLVNPTTAFAEAIEAAGYSTRDFNPLHNDLADIFDRLSEVVPTAAEAIRFFHVRSLPAVMVFASQSGAALREFMKEIEEVGAALRMMTTQTEGLGIKFKQVADRWSVFSVALGQSGVDAGIHLIADAMRGLLAIMTKLVEYSFTTVILAMAATVTAIKGLVGAFNLLKLQAVGAALFGWTGALAAFTVQLKAATVAAYGKAGAIAAVRAALMSLHAISPTGWILALSAAIVGVSTAFNRWRYGTERTLRALSKQRDALQTTADQLSLYREKIEEAVAANKPFMHFVERAAQEIPELRKELIAASKDSKTLLDTMRGFEEVKTGRVLGIMAREAAIAAEEFSKASQILDWLDDFSEKSKIYQAIFEQNYKMMARRQKEVGDAFTQSEARMELYVRTMITQLKKEGTANDELHDKIVDHFEKVTGIKRKYLKVFESIVDDFVKIWIAKDEEMDRQSKRLPKHLQKYADQNQEIADKILKIWVDLVDKRNEIIRLSGVDDLDEEVTANLFGDADRDAQRRLDELTGGAVNLGASLSRVKALMQEMPEDVVKFRNSLGAFEKQDFDLGFIDILEELDKASDSLRKDYLGLSQEEIAAERAAELKLRAIEYAHNEMEKTEKEHQQTLADIRSEGQKAARDRILLMENDLLREERRIIEGNYSEKEKAEKEHQIRMARIRLRTETKLLDVLARPLPSDERKKEKDRIFLEAAKDVASEKASYKGDITDIMEKEDQDAFNRRIDIQQMEHDYLTALARQETDAIEKIHKQHNANLLSLEIEHAKRMREAKEKNFSIADVEKLTEIERDNLEKERDRNIKATEHAQRRQLSQMRADMAERTKSRREAFVAQKTALEHSIAEQLSLVEEGSELYKQIEEKGKQDLLDLTKDFNKENEDLLFERQAILAEASQNEVRIIETNFEHKKALLQREREELAKHLEDSLVAWEWYHIQLRKLEEERDNAITREIGTSWENFKLGLEEAAGEMVSFNEMMFKIGNESVDVLVDGFSEMWSSFVTGTKSAKEAMADFAQSTLKWLTEIILKQMILNAISGFFNKGGPVTTGRSSPEGGVSNFSSGGKIEGHSKNKTEDNILAKVTAGEYVLKVDAVKHYGEDFINALNNLQVPKFAKGGIVGNSLPQTTPNKQPDKINFVMNVENKAGAEVHMDQPTFDGVRWVANMFITAANNNVSGVRDLLGTR